MKILVINCGSSSIKYRLFDICDSRASALAQGLIERIGSDKADIHHQIGGEETDRTAAIKDYHTGIADIAAYLHEKGVLRGDPDGIGHRVVHGAEAFRESVIIDEAVVSQIKDCSQLAPLHNPANLAGIKACASIFPKVLQVAVFDTAFFHTLDRAAYLYALPYEWYSRHRVRRYGFHGTSHRYVSEQAAAFLGKPLSQCNLITMHLGNGTSMAVVRAGRAVNTTMGLTPLEGLVMGTRCGDIDTAIVFHMLRVSGLTVDEVRNSLEKQSGLLGISGVSSDLRDVFEASDGGNDRATLALDIFARRVRKYVGAYLTELDRCDAVVFTGGIGENAYRMRERICAGLEPLGICLDRVANRDVTLTTEGVAIDDGSGAVRILVVPTNEELAIARDSFNLISQQTGETIE